MAHDAVTALPQTEVLPLLESKLGLARPEVQQLLWDAYSPQHIWTHFATIGLVSMVGLLVYDQITRRNLAAEAPLLIGLTALVSFYSYGWTWTVGFVAFMGGYLVIERPQPHWLPQGQGEAEADQAA